MTDKGLFLLTRKSVQSCLAAGGSQSWVLKRANAMQCAYAVLMRNGRDKDVEDTKPHGTAFMIGRIADVVPVLDRAKRWLVVFGEYAEIDMPDAWKGGRNPVAYGTLADLGIKPGDLKFRPMPAASTKESEAKMAVRQPPATPPATLTIAQAKIALAATFGISPDAVEITIRG